MTLGRLAARCSALLAALLLAGCASLGGILGRDEDEAGKRAAGTAAEGPTRVVFVLELEAPQALRALLGEHLDLARFQRLPEDQALSAAELDRLAAAAPAQARALLETEGYFNPTLSLSHPAPQADGLARVRLVVEPGPRTQVARLDLGFAGALQEPDRPDAQALAETLRRQLQQDFGLQPGKTFRQPDWAGAKTETLARTRAGGYPLARWAHTAARVQAERNEAELELLLDSGPLLRLGELQIEGLKHHQEENIRRVSDLRLGQPYTERALLDFQERILKTQLFDSASVDIRPEPGLAEQPAQAEAVPVLVRVKEAPLQQATTGIGYNANTGQRVTLEHLHRQPFGLAMRSLSKLDLGRDLRSASLELTSHPQADMHRNLGSLALEQARVGDVRANSLVARLGRLRETERDERLNYLELLRSHERVAAQSLNARAISLNTQRIRRRVDSTLLPTEGYTALALLGVGHAASSYADNGAFGRLQLKLGWYRPFADKRWFANARFELGQVLVRDGVDMPDRLMFYAGGDDSVRGYAYQSLGVEQNGVTVGGRVMASGSLEIARPISASLPALWGAAFIDAGNAADRWRGFKPVVGWGAGVRLRSPVGPLRLDLARGVQEGRWRLHFSVGIVL
jgi:translocation and assembly module TamA